MESIRRKTATWYDVAIKMLVTDADGMQKTVTERYLVEAVSTSDAEARTITFIQPNGECEVISCKRTKVRELIASDSIEETCIYKVRVQLTTIDEVTAKERKTSVDYIVKSKSVEQSLKDIKETMKETISDWKLLSIAESRIIDVIEA